MLSELFVVCALAAPSLSFTHPAVTEKPTGEIRKISEFVRGHVPGAEVTITPKNQAMAGGWERVPLVWNNMDIWMKGPPAATKRSPAVFAPVLAVIQAVDIWEKTQVFRFLMNYKSFLRKANAPSRVLVMGFREDGLPMLDFFEYGGFRPFGIAHFPFPKTDKPYIRGEYDAMPYKDSAFSMVFAPELHVYHIVGDQFMMINDTQMAFELARITAMGGFFMADMTELQGFGKDLVQAGFDKMDHVFGDVEVWQKSRIIKPNIGELTVNQWIERNHERIQRLRLADQRKHDKRSPIKSAA